MEEKEKYFEQIFANLQSCIGKTISCIYWEFGTLNGYRGILKSVAPFDFINIEDKIINFVGQMTAIQYIILHDKEVVYSVYHNPEVENYKGSLRDPMQVIEAQKKFLGYSIAEEELNTRKS